MSMIVFAATSAVCLAWLFAWRLTLHRKSTSWDLRRVGGIPSHEVVQTKGKVFASILPRLGRSVTLVSVKDGEVLRSLASTPGKIKADDVAPLAEAVGARASASTPSALPGRFWFKAKTAGLSGFDNARGASNTEFAETIAKRTEDIWVGGSVRRAYAWEIAKEREQAHESAEEEQLGRVALQSQQGNASGASMVTIYAGGNDRESVLTTARAAVAGLPGFAAKVRFRSVSETKTVLWLAGFTLAAWIGAKCVPDATGFMASLYSVPAYIAFALATVTVLSAGRMVPWESERLRVGVQVGRLPVPVPRRPSTVLLAPALFVQMAAPQAGDASGVVESKTDRAVSAILRKGEHLIGTAGKSSAFISANRRFEGTAFVGATGSGKSVGLRLLLGSDLVVRRERGGDRDAVVVFESQTESVRDIISWCERTGSEYHLVELATGRGLVLDLFGSKNVLIEDRVKHFVTGFKGTMSASSLMEHGTAMIQALFTLALAITPEIARQAKINPGSPIEYAAILSNSGGLHLLESGSFDVTDLDTQLAEQIRRAYTENPNENSAAVVTAFNRLFGAGITPAKRREAISSSTNKIEKLARARNWFANTKAVSWERLLPTAPVVIINTGTALTGETIDSDTARDLAALIAEQLRPAAENVAADWGDGERVKAGTDRTVTLYLDELAAFASPDFVQWAKERARKLGFRIVVAAQNFDQLPAEIQTVVKGFGAIVWFKQNGRDASDAAINELTAADPNRGDVGYIPSWKPAQLLNLSTGQAILQYSPAKSSVVTAQIEVPYFEQDEDASRFMTALREGRS